MARPPANAPPRYDGKALTKLPPAPRGMSKAQIAIYLEYGTLMVRAGMLGATDVMLLESAARVRAKLDQLYARPDGKEYVIAELEQLHLRHLVKLGLTPASRGQKKLEAPPDGEERRLKALL